MNIRKRSQFALSAAAVMLFAAPHCRALNRSEAWARTQFAAAQHLHEALEGQPAKNLTRADYDHVIRAYHRIYFEAPTSTKADPSVVAVAQLLEEEGRRFEDREILQKAIEQYQFLRQQYPGSKARFGALFRIGEIYKEDLHDRPHAEEVFIDFLQRYPHNQFAPEARKALAEPVEAAAKSKLVPDNPKASAEDKNASAHAADQTETQPAALGVARVSGIRHWSTPEFTRVAIDLEHDVKYESQRIEHPDRVFFDLFDTRLDRTLRGKTYEVSDGFLKKIRISEFKPGQTRIVLEVDSAADFTSSLLSNPPRLVIDLRDKQQARAPAIAPAPAIETASVEVPQIGDEVPLDNPASEGSKGNLHAAVTETDIPPARTTVVMSNGIKKTIVDADDDEPTPPKQKVAKLETPVVKPTDAKATDSKPIDAKSSDGTPPRGRKSAARSRVQENPDDSQIDAHEAQPTAAGDRSLTRVLGLKIGKIVIDPGHGGHDTGTIGPNGLEEKDLVLDVSKRLGKLLVTRLGAEVIYTRSDDTFIPLETRTAIANQENADLFVSVHANSSHDPDARGVETYYLNFTSSADALEVAARENAASDKSIHELQDLVKKIALKEKIEESHEFASDVEHSLHSGLASKNPGLRDRGVKKAPFIVLIGANMPSILSEISFVSNPGDERRLRTPEYRQRIAESLYRGIAKYVNGLSGVKVASKIEKTSGD